MLKLKHQYFGHLMQRSDSLQKILMLGKTEDMPSFRCVHLQRCYCVSFASHSESNLFTRT